MRVFKQIAVGVLGVVVGLGSVGCESKPSMGEFNVTVSLADGFVPTESFEVDLVGVPDGEDKNAIENYSVDNYFGAMNEYRANLDRRIQLVFRPNGDRSQNIDLTRRGSHYVDWKNANVMNLVVLADLPPNQPDLRRRTLTLDKRRWKRKNLVFVIDSQKVSPLYSPEPEKN
jgi:hypothetical protein